MGAWGIGNFENDTALDWVGALQDADDPAAFIAVTLQRVVAETDYLDADASCEALAAAEVVAARLDTPAADFPDELRSWLGESTRFESTSLVEEANNAVLRITTDSELKDLWEESEDLDEWQALQQNLLSRLR